MGKYSIEFEKWLEESGLSDPLSDDVLDLMYRAWNAGFDFVLSSHVTLPLYVGDELFTEEYDVRQDYSYSATVYSGTEGQCSANNVVVSQQNLDVIGHCSKEPTRDDPRLGVKLRAPLHLLLRRLTGAGL